MDSKHDTAPETTHFGFRTVLADDKATLVNAVFDSVASRYDLMNDLMSGGIHRLWKAQFVDWIDPRPGMTLLDVAGGTGDIAFRFRDRQMAKAIRKEAGANPDSLGHVTVCDLNAEMLEVGRDRSINQGRIGGLTWICGTAEALPFPDHSFDVYTIAFGLRNVTRIDVALQEARRVLKPGGRFMCLEFSRVVQPFLRELYDRYSFAVLPRMGRLVTGDGDAYQYLVESIRRFPPQEELSERIKAAGLAQVKYRNLSGGIAAMHSAWRI